MLHKKHSAPQRHPAPRGLPRAVQKPQPAVTAIPSPPPAQRCVKCGGLVQEKAFDPSIGARYWRCMNCGKSYFEQKVAAQPQKRQASVPRLKTKAAHPSRAAGSLPSTSMASIKKSGKSHTAKGLLSSASLTDRIQATIRHPDFRKEAEALRRQMEQETAGKSLAERGHYLSRIHTDNPVARKWDIPGSFTFAEPPARLVHAKDVKGKTIEKRPIYYTTKNEAWHDPMSRAFDHSTDGVAVLGLEENRHLILKVDLTLKAAPKAAGSTVELHQRLLKYKTPRRSKPTKIDPWLVWDLQHNHGKNLLQITQIIFRRPKALPTYNEEMRRFYQQVRRACKQAEGMIDSSKPA